MGKNLKRTDICIHTTVKFAVPLKLTQHCKSTILQYKIKIVKKREREKLAGIRNNVGLISFFISVVLLLATF